MKKFAFGIIAAAIMSFLSFAPAQAGVVSPSTMAPKAQIAESLVEEVGRRRGRRRGRGVAIGAGIVTLGILGAIAADRAHARDYRYSRHERRCRRWRRRCNRGNDRACWRFDSRC